MPHDTARDADVSTLTLEEAAQRLADAEAVRRAAEDAHTRAREVYKAVEGYQSEGRDLARLAMDGNTTAMSRLHEQVRALHSGIVGYLPVPTANDTPGHFYADMEDLGLLIDLPTEFDGEYVNALATAMRNFVRTYQPKTNSPKARSGTQGFAYAQTRAGMLAYGVKTTRPAFLVPLGATESGDDLPKVNYRSLEEALTALPTETFVTSLRERHGSHYFR